MANVKIKVSIPTFHEIVAALEVSGKKLDDSSSITLEKTDAIERPLDWRCITIRKDCLTEACKVYKSPMDEDCNFEINDIGGFINFVDAIYNYVLEGKKTSGEVKIKQITKTKAPATATEWK
jgi:hypothetical protein